MKKLFCVVLGVLMLVSCNQNPSTSSTDISSQDTSSISISEGVSSEEISENTSSQEQIFQFSVNAQATAKSILEILDFPSATVELDNHFIYEKLGISDDMYLDFYGETSYETADNGFIAVFCCNTITKADKLKQVLAEALADEAKISYLSPYAKVFSESGYVVIVATQNNFDEENLVSKLIQ